MKVKRYIISRVSTNNELKNRGLQYGGFLGLLVLRQKAAVSLRKDRSKVDVKLQKIFSVGENSLET